MPRWPRLFLLASCLVSVARVSRGDPAAPAPAYGPTPVVPPPSLLCDFETANSPGIGFEENPAPASGQGRVVDDTAHTGRHSLRIDFTLPSSGAGLFIDPIRVAPDQMPEDPWGLEFWRKVDAPHQVWIDATLEETSGETWLLGAVMRSDGGVTEWHPVRMAFDWAKLVTWNRVDGILDLHSLRSIRITFKALGGQGAQKGTVWVDSIRLLDAAQPVACRAEGDFVLLDLDRVYNSDGVAWRSNPTDGDFHTGEWQQRTLPAEFFPKTSEAVFHDVPFRMPPLQDGVDNHIRSNGQKLVGFPEGPYSALYFLATGKFGDQIGDVELQYADGATSKAALDISDWSQGAHRGDVPAITFPYAYYEHTIEARIPQIFLQSIRVDPFRALRSIRFPENDYLKIFALTMDRAARPVRVGALNDRPVAEVDPRYAMPASIDQDFGGPARPVGVLGGYLARRNTHYSLDIPTFNGFLTYASEALSLPHHTLVFDALQNRHGPYSLGGMQVDGKLRGLVRVDCRSSICATYSCDVTVTSGTQQFTVYLSRAFPAALYEIEARDRYWHDPARGGDTWFSFVGDGGVRAVKADEGVALPIATEPWVLVWHSDTNGARTFDVPILLVLEHKPRELRVERDKDQGGWNLRMKYDGATGRVVAMTLDGIRRLDIAETNRWAAKGIPDATVARCRDWAARLQRFPVDVHEQSELDEAAGRVTLRDRFDFLRLRSEWPVEPLVFTPFPPVAVLAARNGYPVSFDSRAFDTGVDTFWGPLQGVDDDVTSYTIPIPLYTKSMMVSSAVTHQPVAEKVAAELGRLVDDMVPRRLDRERFVSDNAGDMASLRVLAPSRLLLGENERVAAYCRAVVENALKTTNLKLEKEPLTGQFYLMDDRFWAKDAAYDKEWAIGFILQGLWNYSYYCDDAAFLHRYWNRILGLYRYYRIVYDWTTASTWTLATGGGANSDGVRIAWEGMLAMARMAHSVGDDAAYRDAVVRSSPQMMSLYACWFGVQWAADHDYATVQNRHVAPDKAETRFAPDNCWVETHTDNASHTADFFQVTHAFYIYNLGDMLFLHDFGLDRLRLRKWIFEIVPQLHPNWCDGNALCAGSDRYYGNDHAMAHLIARALLFHEDIADLYACYEKAVRGTRVVKEWYSPMGVAPLALAAMLTGSAPLVIVPVDDYRTLENTYDAEARRQRIVLQHRSNAPAEPLRIRCWGAPPAGVTCNGATVAFRYDAATDYATVSLAGTTGDSRAIEVRYP